MVQLWVKIVKELTKYAFSSKSQKGHESQRTYVLLHPHYLDLMNQRALTSYSFNLVAKILPPYLLSAHWTILHYFNPPSFAF